MPVGVQFEVAPECNKTLGCFGFHQCLIQQIPQLGFVGFLTGL